MHETLISCEQLAEQLGRPDWVVIDCRFALDDVERGRQAWGAGHIPGARYAHLNEDLSGEIIPGVTGRHPQPDRVGMALRFASWGVGPRTQVVTYDDAGGAYAARCWWLLRWLGQRSVAVLDGGWNAWLASGGAIDTETPEVQTAEFTLGEPLLKSVSAEQLHDADGQPTALLLDARAAERFRGEIEPLDPVAGHIPGARCLPFTDNLGSDGRFLPAEVLRERFESVLEGAGAARTVCYCGSGVTAAHNVLAMQHAGLGSPALYVGSWSEWVSDPDRAIETGGA